MYTLDLLDGHLFEFLLRCDRDLAREVREAGCGRCGGRLHAANYSRKPRGGPPDADPAWNLCLSFCCAVEGCRKRKMPPSVRFLGRKVYLGGVVVLVSAMRQGLTPFRVRDLQERVGVSRRTLSRWRTWWQTIFPEGPFWRGVRGAFSLPVAATDLPRALLERFGGDGSEQLRSCLRFLAAAGSGAGFLRAAPDPQTMRAIRSI